MSKPVLTIGAVPIHRVEELRIPNTIAHFTDDRDLIAAHRAWLHPHFLDDAGAFDLVFQSWIFEVEGRVVLVDPCTGNGKPHPVPFFDRLDVPFIERMSETGYRPEDIDFVVCTHLHHDHCGWNTRLRDGQWVPTFPNARYVMQQAEVDRWGAQRAQHPPFAYNDLVFERSVEPVLAAGLADLVTGDRRLAPGLAVEAAPGHTIGHQILHLASNGARACFTGDCFHHPIQLVAPGIHFGDTEDKGAVERMRTRLVELAIAHNTLLIPAHLPAPYAVRAWRDHGATRFAAA
jgi:glyoxylase-like metal-dependent hydrolase (beta-lactamase superfamily II)